MPKPGRLYVPLDVNFFDGDGAGLSDEAQLLFLRIIALSKRMMSDGRITRAQIARIAPAMDATVCDELCESQLCFCDESAIVVRSWAEWNDTASAIEERAEVKRSAGTLGNHKRWHEARGLTDPRCRYCDQSAIPIPIAGAIDTDAFANRQSRVEKSKEITPLPEPFGSDFDEIWTLWRKKDDKARSRREYQTRRRDGTTHETLVLCAKHYLASVRDRETGHVKGLAVFLHGPDGPWSEWYAERPSVNGTKPGTFVDEYGNVVPV